MPVQSLSSKMKLNKYKTESGDADSVAQSTPGTTMMLKHQSSLPNLPKRKSKHERQAQNAQSMHMSRSNSSSMVANQVVINSTQQAQNTSTVSGAGRSSQEPSLHHKGNAYPLPSGARRHNKYANANRSPEAPQPDSGEPRPF